MAEQQSILSDPEKKKKFKFLLTLLGALFIILIISVLITRLILGPQKERILNEDRTETFSTISEKNTTNSKEGTLQLRDHSKKEEDQKRRETSKALTSITKEPLRMHRPATNKAQSSEPIPRKHTLSSSKPKKVSSYPKAEKAQKVKKAQKVESKCTSKKPLIHTTSKDEYLDQVVVNRKAPHTQAYIDPNSDKVIISGQGSTINYQASKHLTSSSNKMIRVKKLERGFYLKIGTFKNPSLAIKKIQSTGLHYKLLKTPSGLTQVFIGKFYSRHAANIQMNNAKKITNSPYIIEIK